MNTRISLVTSTAILAFALTGCASTSDGDTAVSTSPTTTATTSVVASGANPTTTQQAVLDQYAAINNESKSLFARGQAASSNADYAEIANVGMDFIRLGMRGEDLPDMPVFVISTANEAWDAAMADWIDGGEAMALGDIPTATAHLESAGIHIHTASDALAWAAEDLTS